MTRVMIICRAFRPFVVAIVLTSTAFLGALELDREEIEEASDVDIEFENYEGPVEEIDSRDSIRGIGRVLGEGVRGADEAVYDQRYLLTRIVGDVDDNRLAADIIELSEDARVDHIENLRRIISGYLESAWDYERNDADLLARFITIYNAVNRGAMDLFSERYREAVTEMLEPDRVGLATSYRRWAGQTQLVVPIRDQRDPGALDAVDPRQLVDARVIDELRTRRDLGIEDRKAIIDFIERVIEERTTAIQEERAALAEEQEAIDERRAELAEEEPADDETPVDVAAEGSPEDEREPEEAVADEPEQAEAAPEPAEDTTQDDTPQPEEEPEEEAEEPVAPDDPDGERRELDDRETEIAERQEELDEEEEELEELTERVEELYDETAEDQAALDEGTSPRELVPFVLGDGTGRFELAVVDFGEASIAGEQTIPVAHRELTEFQGAIVVAHNSTGRLLMLDPSSLAVIAESESTVVPGSRIRVVDGHLLTVISQDDGFVVGEFDAQLVLQRRSARPVLEDTDIVVRQEDLLVQGADRELRVLRLDEVAQ